MGESTEGLEMDLPPKSGPIAVGDGLFTCNGRLARYVSNDPDRARLDLFFAWPSLGKPDIIHPAQPFPLSITISARIGVWERLKTRQPTLLRQFVETCFLLQRVGGALQTATLVVEPAPQVAERSFANLADIPLDVLGIAGNQTLAAIEAGNARQRANLLAVGRAAFGNAGLITDALGNTAGSAVAFAAPTDGGASDDDIPPAEKTVFKTTLNLRLADKSKVSDSTLYNVHVRNPGGFSRRVVPHAYYVKESWQDFSFIHATDLHISLRTDQFRKKLRQAGKDEGADRYTNPNDAFRDLIHYANHLHEIGMLDFILATGDIVDYAAEWPQNASAGADKSRLYVYDPVPGSQKNLDLFTQLVLGRSPYPDREMTKLVQEELRVPIFTTMGNHDYRLNPYPLQAKVVVDDDGFFGKAWNVLTGGVSKFVDILGDAFKGNPENLLKLAPTFLHPLLLSLIDLKITDIEQERCFNLTKGEAKVLHGGSTPKIGAFGDDAPLKSLEAKRDPILDLGESYYMLRLGPHRLVMLDTGHDAGIFSNTIDALVAYLGFASEDAVNLADGTPNSVGIDAFEIGLVRQAMLEAGNGGLVIVGLHAPPLNPKGDEYPHYFRETEHATASGTEVVGYLLRQVGPSALTDPKLLQDWQLRPDLTLKPTAFFKSGRLNTLLDWGIASRIEGKTGEFLKLCVGRGTGIARPVDLVLFGHIHHRVEYRLDWEGDADNGDMRYFMDFYSQNPKRYYRSRRAGGGDAVHVRVTNRQTVGAVERVPVAEPDPTWGRWPRIDVPRYPNPLNSAPNPAAWWLAHRPILAQTASLGLTEANDRAPEPLDVPPGPFGAPPILEKKSRPGPSFQGFRVIFVRGNVITKMRYVNLRNLRRNDFQMPWELGADIGLEEEDFDGPDHAKLFEA